MTFRIICKRRAALLISVLLSVLILIPVYAEETELTSYVDIPGAGSCLAINEESFPDENFRGYIIGILEEYGKGIAEKTGGPSPFFNIDGRYFFSAAALPYVTAFDAGNLGIKSLEGIENFKALSMLSVSHNELSSLDLSENPRLTALDASYNELASLNISACPSLSGLNVMKNSLGSLDISKNKELKAFACTYNSIDLLDFRGNLNLDPFKQDSFNIAFQSGETIILCDPGSAMEEYCKTYLIPFSASLKEKRPDLLSGEGSSVLMVREKADLKALLSAKYGGEAFDGFSASPEGVVNVNKKGIIRGKKAGETVITAKGASGREVNLSVKVEEPVFCEKKIKSVSLNEVIYAESLINGTAFRPDGYLSSREKTAEIDPVTGRIVVRGKGKTRITALYGSGKNARKISFRLKVSLPYLNKKSLYLKTGGYYRLKLKGTKEKPVFYSSDESKVSVGSTTGEITALSTGTARVYAVLNGVEYECRVTVVSG